MQQGYVSTPPPDDSGPTNIRKFADLGGWPTRNSMHAVNTGTLSASIDLPFLLKRNRYSQTLDLVDVYHIV
jgi:hypothetical protein